MPKRIRVIDSHTAGEPTRVIVSGGPDLGDGPLDHRLQRMRSEFDHYRTTTVREPRGADVLVGAILCPPHDDRCDAAVIFFNNVGYLGMCGHGMIGVVRTLLHQNSSTQPKELTIETPVGIVKCVVNEDSSVTIDNVDSFRKAHDVSIEVDGVGTVVGDVAWGGNWFYLVNQPKMLLSLADVKQLQAVACKIRDKINASGYPEVDHVELFADPTNGDADSQNFVLCPGLEYDRSACGTGTSAKLACLAADGKLAPGETWTQQGILGTTMRGSFQWSDQTKGIVAPKITGSAHIIAEAELLLFDDDPFQWGIV